MRKSFNEPFPTIVHAFSLLFITFSTSLFWIVNKAFMLFIFDIEWGSVHAQPQEVVFFDLILFFKLLVAFFLLLKLKNNFIKFYLSLYPSVEVLAIIILWLTYGILHMLAISFGVKLSTIFSLIAWLIPAGIIYFLAFYLPIRDFSSEDGKTS